MQLLNFICWKLGETAEASAARLGLALMLQCTEHFPKLPSSGLQLRFVQKPKKWRILFSGSSWNIDLGCWRECAQALTAALYATRLGRGPASNPKRAQGYTGLLNKKKHRRMNKQWQQPNTAAPQCQRECHAGQHTSVAL